jgi:hypothetical protein
MADLPRRLQSAQDSLDYLTRVGGTMLGQQLRQQLPPDHLAHHGYSVYSESDEDGIIAEILRRTGTPTRRFVEIGVGDGLQCNTTHLLQQEWSGTWIEGDAEAGRRIRQFFSAPIQTGRLNHRQEYATMENIGGLLPAEEIDLLSIDIDGNDFWIWQALPVSARVVVIEYNAGLGPEIDWVMPYDSQARWDGTRYHGATLRALHRLGLTKGYRLVGCNITGVNAFFVREDCCGMAFPPTADPRAHYLPPMYSSNPLSAARLSGHPVSPREILPR